MEITNDAIAEHVMGWTQKPIGPWQKLHWVDSTGFERDTFTPLWCASEDYLVFNHVRDQIDECNPRYAKFYEHLLDVLQSNPNGGPPIANYDHLHLMHWYRVGDYSRAAMATIKQS